MWESPWQCWCPSFSSSASSTACKVFIYRHQHILIKEHYPTETDHTEMHGPSKSQNSKSSVQWSSGRPGARSGRGRCRPPAGSRRSQCLPIPCLVIINIGGMQKKKMVMMTKTKDKDTLPLLPASAIRCRRGELEAPVPSSRMSPWVANAATVRRMLGEP